MIPGGLGAQAKKSSDKYQSCPKIGQPRYLSEKFAGKNRTTKVQPLYSFKFAFGHIFQIYCNGAIGVLGS